ncbi:hypothetical protein [Trichormus azollae]|jgi:hypothetical protein|uniref:hypothetical protein n=1 Tax=Trichormus azollae TaxID=1164 RepID=UPI0002FF8E09|nr:hypothetical protein [Trichormus azollae]
MTAVPTAKPISLFPANGRVKSWAYNTAITVTKILVLRLVSLLRFSKAVSVKGVINQTVRE